MKQDLVIPKTTSTAMGDKKTSKRKVKAPEHYEVYTAKMPDPMNLAKHRA